MDPCARPRVERCVRAPATTEKTAGTGNRTRPVPCAGCSDAVQAPERDEEQRHAGGVRLTGHGQRVRIAAHG